MLNTTRAAALPIALLLAAIIAAFTLVLAQNLQTDARTQVNSAQITRSVALARGGTNAGFAAMRGELRNDLSVTIGSTANPTNRWAYGTSAIAALEPTAESTATSLQNVQTIMQGKADALLCSAPLRSSNGDQVTLRMHFTNTACGQTIPTGTALPPGRFVEGGARTVAGTNSSQTFSIPYVLVATGTVTGAKRTIATQGEYRFTLGRTSFSRYALFTHIHTNAAGNNVVFTDSTLFNGPVHTNGHFIFASGNPYFASYITSAGCTDNASLPAPGGCPRQVPGAYTSTSRTTFRPANTFPTDIQTACATSDVCPEFQKGYDLKATYMAMPTTNASLRLAATTGGIYMPGDAQVHLWTGGTNAATSNGGAEYQYIATCPTNATSRSSAGCITYRVKDGQIQTYVGPLAMTSAAAWSAATPFNGVIHSDGNITRLAGPARTTATNPASSAPAVHRNSNITVSSTNNVRITTDLRYENQPCSGSLGRNSSGAIQNPDCSNTEAKNVLGVYSQNGSVLIGTSYNTSTCTTRSFSCAVVNPLDHAPNNVTINGVLMSATREVAVERHDIGPDRGQVNVLGGMIQYYYGAVGTVSGHGFGRSITYDARMLTGLSPSAFPNTYTDEVKSVFTYAFGEREQP